MSKRTAAGALLGLCLASGLVAGCASAGSTTDADTTSVAVVSALRSVDTSSVAAAAQVAAPRAAGERVAVTRVIDGDTVEVTGRRTVRLLGIDSCESNTAAGRRATTDASNALLRRTVTLHTERGVNRDRYQRELRYITMPGGQDFGQMMVTKTHTAVYAGRNDASPAYVATLRRLDTNGRTCCRLPKSVARIPEAGCTRGRVNPPGLDGPCTGAVTTSWPGNGGGRVTRAQLVDRSGLSVVHTGCPGGPMLNGVGR